MSNLEDANSASSASAYVEMVHAKQEEMPNIAVEHLRTLCQGHVNNALIEWAMVTPRRKCNFIQAVKQAMTQNNLWTHAQETLIKELARYPPTANECGNPDGLLFMLNDVDPRYGDNVH